MSSACESSFTARCMHMWPLRTIAKSVGAAHIHTYQRLRRLGRAMALSGQSAGSMRRTHVINEGYLRGWLLEETVPTDGPHRVDAGIKQSTDTVVWQLRCGVHACMHAYCMCAGTRAVDACAQTPAHTHPRTHTRYPAAAVARFPWVSPHCMRRQSGQPVQAKLRSKELEASRGRSVCQRTSMCASTGPSTQVVLRHVRSRGRLHCVSRGDRRGLVPSERQPLHV